MKKPRFIIPIISAFIYLPVLFGFFQQDEWLLFARLFSVNSLHAVLSFSFAPSIGHYVPATQIVAFIYFYFFKLNYIYYALAGLFGQFVVTFLVYKFAERLTKDSFKANVCALIFAASYAGYQATAWPVAEINIHFAAVFALISLNFALDKKINKSVIFLFISLLFKEVAIAFFVLIPFMLLLFQKEFFLKNRLRVVSSFLVSGCFYALARVGMIFIIPKKFGQASDLGSYWSMKDLVYDFLTFPVKSITQTLIPEKILVAFSTFFARFLPVKLTGVAGTPGFDWFVLKRAVEFVNFVFASFVLMLVSKLAKSKRSYKNIIIFSVIFVIFNSFIFSFSPETTGITTVLDSRNLYFLTIGSSVGLGVFLVSFIKNKKALFILLAVYLIGNIILLEGQIIDLMKTGEMRKNVLVQIKSNYLSLPQKVVFYSESDSSFYGLPEEEKIMPFQSGFGNTLLVYYEPTEKFPDHFLNESFLWNLDSQGYKEINNRGFGYFRNFKDLASFVSKNNFDVNSIISFRYTSATNFIKDISGEVRGRIKGYESKKKEIELNVRDIVAIPNADDKNNLLDGKSSTIWDSKIPYKTPQSITIDLKASHRVVEIDIDPYNNEDQDKVGYIILVSSDGKTWEEIFRQEAFSQKKGVFELYLPPTNARFVKINEMGKHDFASWIIGEIKIYEAIF